MFNKKKLYFCIAVSKKLYICIFKPIKTVEPTG